MDQLNGKAAELNHLSRRADVELSLIEKPMLAQLPRHQPQGQLGAVEGDVEFLEQEGQRPDVILMPVGEEDAADFAFVAFDKGKIGYNQIHPQHILVREGQAAVDDKHIVAALIQRHIFSDFVEAAQKINPHRLILAVLADGLGRNVLPAGLRRRRTPSGAGLSLPLFRRGRFFLRFLLRSRSFRFLFFRFLSLARRLRAPLGLGFLLRRRSQTRTFFVYHSITSMFFQREVQQTKPARLSSTGRCAF